MTENMEINIEELVLDGFAPGERYTIGNAIENELIRLFNDNGTPASLSGDKNIYRIDAGMFRISQTSESDTIGRQIANSIYKGLNR